MTINLNELFDPKTEIRITFRGEILIYTLRHPVAEEWLEYNRRASSFHVRKRKLSGTEESAGARLWLLAKIREKVEVQNGAERILVEDLGMIPPNVEDQAILAYLGQVELEEAEEGKNS